ncbi:hypothetical protein LWI29_006813 [Acer saccharum]|uniref:Protein kinase domain-containing protein n=1 Tax=Acer saccharum TaxID=4024 RepID=A0AA39W5W9_ACESA|nr:hypothetical protein LWI29_006813 [Acer saccharum]
MFQIINLAIPPSPLPATTTTTTTVQPPHQATFDCFADGKVFLTGLWRRSMVSVTRDMVSGLVHLHELGVVHRDLKPQNVLTSRERSLCAKLSDIGISKRLLADMSSLGHHAIGKYSV